MRIHTNLDWSTVYDVGRRAGVIFEVFEDKGSRKRDRAFEIRLSGSGRMTTGPDGLFQAATWDEWGVFFALLFAKDASAIAGQMYNGSDEFHSRTAGRFSDLTIPKDTHKQHRWEFHNDRSYCTKCSASFSWRKM